MDYRLLESHIVEAVKDEPLPRSVPELEAQIGQLSTILSSTPIVTIEPGVPYLVLPYNDATELKRPDKPDFFVFQPSSDHKRSLALEHPKLTQPWHDEFGNTYHSLNLKGNNFSHAKVIERSIDGNQVSAYGLLESDVIRRVLRGSRLLRAESVTTEFPVGLAEPKELPWPHIEAINNHYDDVDFHELVSLAEYKQRLVERTWNRLPEAKRTVDNYVELATKLEHMTFYIMLRAMDTSFRLADIKSMAQDVVPRSLVFNIVNNHMLSDGEAPLDPSSPKDVWRFACLYFAPRLARNVAGMHKLGLAHGFLSPNNISALGSIVDLDSLHGSALELGDEPISVGDRVHDIRNAMRVFKEFFGLKGEHSDLYPSPFQTFADIYMDTLNDELLLDAIACDMIATENESANGTETEGIFNQMVDDIFIRTYLKKYNKTEAVDLLFLKWEQEEFPKLIETANIRLSKIFGNMCMKLVDQYLDEINRDWDFDILAPLLDDPEHPVRKQAVRLFFADFMEEWLMYYVNKNDSVTPETFNDTVANSAGDSRISPGFVQARDVFSQWHNNEAFLEMWPFLESLVIEYADKLRDFYRYELPSEDFRDATVRLLGMTDGMMLSALSGVPVRKAVLHIDPAAASIQITEMPVIDGGYYKTKRRGRSLRYLITDVAFDCERLSLGEYRTNQLLVNKFEQQFMLAVSVDKDGNKHYIFYTTDNTLLESASEFSDDTNKLYKLLRNRYADHPVLFD